MAGTEAPLVLVVAADAVAGRSLAAEVERLGYRTRVAADAEAALAGALAEGPIAVIVAATSPPDALARCVGRLRSERRTAALPVLHVVADTQPETRRAAFAAGVDDVLCRPYPAEELAARLRLCARLAGNPGAEPEAWVSRAELRRLSHDLNNPVQSVIGGVHLLRLSREPRGDYEAEALAMLGSAAERLMEIARRLAALAHGAD